MTMVDSGREKKGIKQITKVVVGEMAVLLCLFLLFPIGANAEEETVLEFNTISGNTPTISGNVPEPKPEPAPEPAPAPEIQIPADTEDNLLSELIQEPADADYGPDAVVTTPDELVKWGINYNATTKTIDGVSNAQYLPEILIIPEGVEAIAQSAFWGRTEIKKIVFPDSLVSIYPHSFNGCTGLEEIIMGSGLKEIYLGVFIGCSSLRLVDLSRADNVEIFTRNAFGNASIDAPFIIDTFIITMNEKSLSWWDSEIVTGGSGIRNLKIIEPRMQDGSARKSDITYKVFSDFIGYFRFGGACLEKVEVSVNHGGNIIDEDITAQIQMRNLTKSYMTDNNYGAKTDDELWQLCFSADSAGSASIWGGEAGSGVSALQFESFIDFYNSIPADTRDSLNSYVQDGKGIVDIYNSLLNSLNIKSTELAESSIGDIELCEEDTLQAAEIPQLEENPQLAEIQNSAQKNKISNVIYTTEETHNIKSRLNLSTEPANIRLVPGIEYNGGMEDSIYLTYVSGDESRDFYALEGG